MRSGRRSPLLRTAFYPQPRANSAGVVVPDEAWRDVGVVEPRDPSATTFVSRGPAQHQISGSTSARSRGIQQLRESFLTQTPNCVLGQPPSPEHPRPVRSQNRSAAFWCSIGVAGTLHRLLREPAVFHLTASRAPCRCRRRTVSGWTRTRASRHPGQILERQTHISRSDARSGTRLPARWRSRTRSWWRRANTSAWSAARLRNKDRNDVRAARRAGIIAEPAWRNPRDLPMITGPTRFSEGTGLSRNCCQRSETGHCDAEESRQRDRDAKRGRQYVSRVVSHSEVSLMRFAVLSVPVPVLRK